jgi:hypothetical protein
MTPVMRTLRNGHKKIHFSLFLFVSLPLSLSLSIVFICNVFHIFTSPPHIFPNIVDGERSAISDIFRSSCCVPLITLLSAAKASRRERQRKILALFFSSHLPMSQHEKQIHRVVVYLQHRGTIFFFASLCAGSLGTNECWVKQGLDSFWRRAGVGPL